MAAAIPLDGVAASSGGAFAPEKAALDHGVLGGILLIVIAGEWFVLG